MPPFRALFYAATLGAALLTVHSVLRGPPPLHVSVALLVAYLAFLGGAVFCLRWRVFVDAVIAGPKASRGVALTFDDGPDAETTRRVLDALAMYKVTATFFVIGEKAEKHPDLVREVVARGHSIGLHAYRHARLYAMKSEEAVKRDLEQGIRVLEEITGVRPSWFRPPIGHTHPGIARAAESLDLTVVGWSVSARDGLSWTHEADVVGRVRRGAKDGAVILMHDASERGAYVPAGVRALPDVLAMLEGMRLPVVPLAAWVDSVDGVEGVDGTEAG
jgi:peptidoglycan/xylan/chitin deacetylase (PgdA/CDA1 family)